LYKRQRPMSTVQHSGGSEGANRRRKSKASAVTSFAKATYRYYVRVQSVVLAAAIPIDLTLVKHCDCGAQQQAADAQRSTLVPYSWGIGKAQAPLDEGKH
jgi:hypothetical protein